MQVRLDSGWIGAAIAAAAAGATVMWPEYGHSLGIALFAIAALVLILGIRIEGFRIYIGRRRRMAPLIGMIIFGVGFLVSAGFYFWPSPNGVPSEAIKKSIEIKTEYAGLSNSQLRNLVISFATEMRKLEIEYKNKQSEINQMGIPDPTRSFAEREKLWVERTTKYNVARNEEVEVFQSKFLSESRSLHSELLKRLDLEYPKLTEKFDFRDMTKRSSIMLLDTGFVAGAQPISDLANYLEDLAKKLP